MKDSFEYRIVEDLEDIKAVERLQREIWGQDVVSPLPQLVANIRNGGLVIGTFKEDRLIAFTFSYPGYKNNETFLISHMTGVSPDYQNYGIGYQLKKKQRDWALDYGYKKITWTCDPLEGRNGYFNFCKLGAFSREYIPSYYGEMKDKLNHGLPADRLVVEWEFDSQRVEKALNGSQQESIQGNYSLLLSAQTEGEKQCLPREGEEKIYSQEKGYFVAVPMNIHEMKKTSPEEANAWRFALRKTLTEAFQHGFAITGVKRIPDSVIHYYILEKTKDTF